MNRSEIVVDAEPADVWATLADASTFKDWVVGCKEIRHVEGDWPAKGSAIHHSVGVGSLTIDDTTWVEQMDPQERLVLRARARPALVADVEITLEATSEGGTVVVMQETVVDGAASHAPDVVSDPILHARNAESLRRLKRLAEDRSQMPGR